MAHTDLRSEPRQVTVDLPPSDLEGHDDPTAPTTALRAPALALVSEFSRAAKAAGFVVGLAPASDNTCCFYDMPAQWMAPCLQWAAGEKRCHLPPAERYKGVACGLSVHRELCL